MKHRLDSDRPGVPSVAALVVAACVAVTPGWARHRTAALIPRIAQMAPADRAPTKNCTFVLRTTLPAAPDALRVYRVQADVAKKPILLKLIKALPLEPTPEVKKALGEIGRAPEPAEEGAAESVGGWMVQVVRGGAWSCSRDDSPPVDKTKVRPPSAESVRKVADAFLARTGLMPKGVRFSGVQATEWMDGTAVSWAAFYRGSVDGTPVPMGARVDVGPDLQLLRVSSSFRRLVPDRMVPILSAQEAYDLLRAGKGYFNATTVTPGRRSVTSVRLAYWQGAFAVAPDYVVPIYLFDTDTGQEPCSAFVEAIRPEYLEKPDADHR